jgi:hypothetical protein
MKPEYKKVSFSKLTLEGYELVEHSNGSKYWYLNGKLHREDGPAIEHSSGNKFWWLNGKEISLETKSEDPKVKKLQEFMKIQEMLEK